MDTFLNPIPGISLRKWISFDYPLGTRVDEYRTDECHRNTDLFGDKKKPTSEVPTQEGIYGKLGSPARYQGFPCMGEVKPEDEDPFGHDQIVDIDRSAFIDHTARLSGSFVKSLAHFPGYVAIVKMNVVALTHGNGTPVQIYKLGPLPLTPVSGRPDNKWYWEDGSRQQELICTAHNVITPAAWKQYGLKPGIYNLVINWEFWDNSDPANSKRLPMSGFDESISFELCDSTIKL